MEMEDARDVFQVFVGAGDEFIGGIGKSRFGPENDNVRKHRRIEGSGARVCKLVLGIRSGAIGTSRPTHSGKVGRAVPSAPQIRVIRVWPGLTGEGFCPGITALYEELSSEPAF